MSLDSSTKRWQPPAGGPDALKAEQLRRLSETVNQLNGLHSAVIEQSWTLQTQDRLLRIGPQAIPVGVTLSVQPGAIVTVL